MGHDAAGQIVFRPACRHDDLAGVFRKPGRENRLIPIPMPLFYRGAQGFFFVLDRVVDDANIQRAPGQAGTYADAQVAAGTPGRRKFPDSVDVIPPFFRGLGE